MCRVVVERRSVVVSIAIDWEYQSVGDLVIEHECDRMKETLHESDRDRLVYTDGTDTSSVAPSQYLCSE